MSQPSRAERRRQTRGTMATPPPRDPMRPIYIGVGILLLLIVAIFGLMRWQQDNATQSMLKSDYATPSPGPNANAKPIKLADGGSIGAPKFKEGNAPGGGHGEPVDGIQCLGMEGQGLHVHSHLALFANGKQIQIPRLLGATPTAAGGCLYWIHTHDGSGIIHIESPQVIAPQGDGHYTLGMMFDIWGEPLSRTGVAGFLGPVTAYVNGAPYDGDLRAIPLVSHQEITLEVGTPVVPPPNYKFPPND
ncbi:MAG: hypothetical protein JO175_01510 [Candidatus Eremiobacteraeota bacterium]|nr:hypothetical protein [Candidatus Eremiobacteraeota bacterium]